MIWFCRGEWHWEWKVKGRSKAKFKKTTTATNSSLENKISSIGKCSAHYIGHKTNGTYCSGVCEGRPDMKLRHSSGAEDTWPLSTTLPASDLSKWCIPPITTGQDNTSPYLVYFTTLHSRQLYGLQTPCQQNLCRYGIYILPFDSWPSYLLPKNSTIANRIMNCRQDFKCRIFF